MQFETCLKIGQQKFVVTLLTAHKISVLTSLFEAFQRIGGTSKDNAAIWEFPLFISSEVIKEIIHNTCFVCGGLMQNGEALQNTLVSFDDFGNDAGQRGTTQSRVGEPKILQVRKCSSCGHSHT